MLNLNPDIVCALIERAREFHAKEAVVLPEEVPDPDSSAASGMLAEHQGDPTLQEFKTTVEELEPDQQVALVALMWLGRGDFDADEWATALREAADSWTPHTAEQLLATPLVADYLDEGLALLGYSCGE